MTLPCPAQVVEASSDDGSSLTTTPYINDLGEAQRWDEPPAEMLGYTGRWVVQHWERLAGQREWVGKHGKRSARVRAAQGGVRLDGINRQLTQGVP